MTDPADPTERHVEVEGQVVVCLVRAVRSPAGGEQSSQWSFDRGEAWHDRMITAYEHAKGKGALMRIGSTDQDGGSFEAFVLGLVHEISALEAGECLKIVKDQTTVVVVKEQAVLSCRVSTIKDVDLRMEGQA